MQDETLNNMTGELTEQESELVKVATEKFRADVKTYALKYKLPDLDVSFDCQLEEAERAGRKLAFHFMHSVYFLGEEETTVSFRVPATWLDMLVIEHGDKLPNWISRRIDVKYKELSKRVLARAVLPGVPVEAFGKPVYFFSRKMYP
jgi:hypothetical protein